MFDLIQQGQAEARWSRATPNASGSSCSPRSRASLRWSPAAWSRVDQLDELVPDAIAHFLRGSRTGTVTRSVIGRDPDLSCPTRRPAAPILEPRASVLALVALAALAAAMYAALLPALAAASRLLGFRLCSP